MLKNILVEKAVFHKPEKAKQYLNGKVVFEAYLQEANTTNQNKRVYPQKVLADSVRRIQDKIDRRAFLGELDHPISDNQIRQTTVLYKEASHLIREIWWENNLMRGVVETLPYTRNGKTLGGMVMDNITVGFSLRGLADVQDNGSAQVVMAPLLMICYDAVSEPSNHRATIQEVRNEQLVHVLKESSSMIKTDDGKCYLPNLFDQMVEQKLIALRKKWWQ